MEKTRNLGKVKGILARFLKSSSCKQRDLVKDDPSPHYLELADKLLHLRAAVETGKLVKTGKLVGLDPVWRSGRWVTRGRFGQGLFKILGVAELPLLTQDSRLAYLVMVQAHNEDHKEAKVTLARSRAYAWVQRGMSLAKRIVKECQSCKLKRKCLVDQKMGDLPPERWEIGSPPWINVSLDLMGPMEVKSMVNSRAKMKVWPLLVACLSTGAVHAAVMHDYGTGAFLLQWENFTALRGCPKLVWSDRGSQLTSAGNYVTWSAREDPSTWGWDEISAQAARQGTSWRFVPAGCQFRNGLAVAGESNEADTHAHHGGLDHQREADRHLRRAPGVPNPGCWSRERSTAGSKEPDQ